MKYDLALFEELNREYGASSGPRSYNRYDRDSRRKHAEAFAARCVRDLQEGFEGKVVLDLGCYDAWLTALMRERGASRVIGIDVARHPSWDEHEGVTLLEGDLASSDLVPRESVDLVVSNAVLEHVEHPLEMLAAIRRVLRPGGKAWLRFNLYRGPAASHRYREVFFPWPHLLFEEEVCRAFYVKHHGQDWTFLWVNKLALAQYVEACRELGMGVRSLSRKVVPIDLPFYERFEEKLGRYPVFDLETDFATLVLTDEPVEPLALGYVHRQREFEAERQFAPGGPEETARQASRHGRAAATRGVPSGAVEYDLALFEQLNGEYQDSARPAAPSYDPDSRRRQAEATAARCARDVQEGFEGKVVLEVGCGHAWLTALMRERGASRAIGIDIERYPSWDEHEGITLLEGDLASSDLVPPESVDLVVSNAVLEHVEHPLEMLAAIRRVLRPGGKAWLRFNLYRGPRASHRYREVFFPWPHLLFEEGVCRAFYAEHHGRDLTFAWVNKLTLADYVAACRDLDWGVRSVSRIVRPVDLALYERFEEKLGRYPVFDLETDFATLVLTHETVDRPVLGYVQRQLEFETERELARQT